MGIDLTVTKGYGVLISLAENEERYREILDEEIGFYETYPNFQYGVSGSYSMSGASDDDVIWIAPSRLVEDEDAKHSDGFIWTFDEVPTEDEVAELQRIAEELFSVTSVVKVEPFVAFEVY